MIVSVNGANLGGAAGVTGAPNAMLPVGFKPAYSDTSSIHFSDHGPFCDQRMTFPAELLRAGRNTISITMDTRKMTAFLMVDYLRLELPGYIPPAPEDVTAFAGNNRILTYKRELEGQKRPKAFAIKTLMLKRMSPRK